MKGNGNATGGVSVRDLLLRGRGTVAVFLSWWSALPSYIIFEKLVIFLFY